MMFAKLFDTEEHGQILAKVDSGEDGPEVRFYFKPENLGVCSLAISAKDNEDGWKFIDETFEKITVESATKMVVNCKKEAGL